MILVIAYLVLKHVINMWVLLLCQHQCLLAHLRKRHVLFSSHRGSSLQVGDKSHFTKIIILLKRANLVHN